MTCANFCEILFFNKEVYLTSHYMEKKKRERKSTCPNNGSVPNKQSNVPPSVENHLLVAFSLLVTTLSTLATSYLDETCTFSHIQSGSFTDWHLLHYLALMAPTDPQLRQSLLVESNELLSSSNTLKVHKASEDHIVLR